MVVGLVMEVVVVVGAGGEGWGRGDRRGELGDENYL